MEFQENLGSVSKVSEKYKKTQDFILFLVFVPKIQFIMPLTTRRDTRKTWHYLATTNVYFQSHCISMANKNRVILNKAATN